MPVGIEASGIDRLKAAADPQNQPAADELSREPALGAGRGRLVSWRLNLPEEE